MNKKIFYSCFVLILLFSCSSPNPKNQYSLYLAKLAGSKYPVSLWVNNKLIYDGQFEFGKNSEVSNYMYISQFPKQGKTIFRISTANRDTTFSYKTDTIEKLYIWIPSDKSDFFEIVDNNSPRKKGDAGIE